MSDNYGDGWQGAVLEVFINNTSVGTYSAVNSGNSINFSICDGDELVLSYSSGDWENENAYTLFDAAWNAIFQDGPFPDTGLIFSSVGNCSAPILQGGHPCTAIPIDTGLCILADNTGFPTSGLNPNCTSYQGGDIWFTMEVPASGNLSFGTNSGNLSDTALGIWAGSSCDQLTLLGCDDDGGTGYYSSLVLEQLTPGQRIYIQVMGYNGAQGTFQICVNNYEPVVLVSSELPIVMINTLGETIVPETKVDCLMEIKYNGPGNITYLTSNSNVYNGNIGIEIRGATSSGYAQKPYGIETRTPSGANNNVSILGMPAENDWVLLSNYGDRSLLRNLISFKLFGEMGNYSTRAQLCEVLIDSSYQGIYLIGEKIKRDKDRVDIANLTPSDTLGNDLTGGYILQQNYWNENNSFQSAYAPINHPGLDIHFVYEYPDEFAIQPAQKTYIAAYINSLETALYSPGFANPATGYRQYLDVKSFIDYFLLNELARNTDGFKKSIFYYKDKNSNGGKLKAGPVWDFDWAWKNISACSAYENFDGSGWAHLINDCGLQDIHSSEWFVRLLQDNAFKDELRCTYEDYRQGIFSSEALFAYIDSMGALVQNAQARHFYKWPILGEVVAAPETGPIATSYNAELDTLKSWIASRLQWLDENIPGLCTTTSVTETNSGVPIFCYPNPVNDYLNIEYSLSSLSTVSTQLYNSLGEKVSVTNKGMQDAGNYRMTINTSDLSAGIYWLKFERGKSIDVIKISCFKP